MPPNLAVPAATVVNPHKSERVKMMSKALRASVLLLLLVCPARAGWMPYGSPEPPPPAPSAVQGATQENAGDSPSSLTDIVLGLLSGVGSLF